MIIITTWVTIICLCEQMCFLTGFILFLKFFNKIKLSYTKTTILHILYSDTSGVN